MQNVPARIVLLTAIAMIAFASNSILCRLALKQTTIDPASFTFIRILSGAIALWLIVQTRRASLQKAGSWFSAFALFVYAAAFSFAYLSLTAGTGALLLFGAVQATMILWSLVKGERLSMWQLIGLFIAMIGLIVLVFPGLSAPPLSGAILMLSAGIAWGSYSLRGKGERSPAIATTGNFLRAVPFVVILSVCMFRWIRLDGMGVFYAILSGAITSGLGYVIWYSALSYVPAAIAATLQLSVPVLAAAGGILFLGEPLNLRFVVASITVLGGIALVVLCRRIPSG